MPNNILLAVTVVTDLLKDEPPTWGDSAPNSRNAVFYTDYPLTRRAEILLFPRRSSFRMLAGEAEEKVRSSVWAVILSKF
jgi:hypothetical protein